MFAHNGNLNNLGQSRLQPSGRYQPVGTTDSELAFCLLLSRVSVLEHAPRQLPALQLRLDAVAAMAEELRSFGPSSFLYADGDLLFVHADRRLQPLTGQVSAPALYRLACPADVPPMLLDDSHRAVSGTAQRVLLLASVPLTDEVWKPMSQGELMAVRNGEIVAALTI